MGWAPTIRPPRISVSVVRHLLEALAGINADHMRAHPTPKLYASGVRYRREPRGLEQWLSVPEVIARGYGDCEDLAAWRVAELRSQGEHATFGVSGQQRDNGKWTFHITVHRGDGTPEDPSRRLGM
jgi:hypothetical protein